MPQSISRILLYGQFARNRPKGERLRRGNKTNGSIVGSLGEAGTKHRISTEILVGIRERYNKMNMDPRERSLAVSKQIQSGSEYGEMFTKYSLRTSVDGTYRMRFLPDADSDKEYYRRIAVHYNLGNRGYTCPKRSHTDYEFEADGHGGINVIPVLIGDQCPACDYASYLLGTGVEEDRDQALGRYGIVARVRYVFNVSVLRHPTILNRRTAEEIKYDPNEVYVFNGAPRSIKEGFNNIGGLDQIFYARWQDGEESGYIYPCFYDYDDGILLDVIRTNDAGFTKYRVESIESRDARWKSDPRPREEWEPKVHCLTEWVRDVISSPVEDIEKQVLLFQTGGLNETPAPPPKPAVEKVDPLEVEAKLLNGEVVVVEEEEDDEQALEKLDGVVRKLSSEPDEDDNVPY